MFKRFFGSEDYVFLTTMLVESLFNMPRHSLDGSVITNSVKINRRTIYNKSFELDVLLETPNGDMFCLEMQPVYNMNAEIKNISYLCVVFSESLRKGNLYSEAKSATLINFSKKIYIHKSDKIIKKFYLISEDDLKDKALEDLISYLIVDIDTNNDKTYNNDSNGFKLMRQLLGAENLEDLENAIKNLNEPLLSNLLKDMVMFMELEYVQNYNAKEKLIRSNLHDAKESGLAEGEKNKQLEIAVNFLKSNVSLETIASCTGLSLEELKKLQEENK